MPFPLRVLILEDRKADLELMLYELRRAGFDPDFRHVENESDYRASLDRDFDVILADYTLPRFDALRALRILQERGLPVPFIVVTGSLSEEAAVECMKSGAADYLLKDRLARLGPAVQGALDSRRIREAKLGAEEEIRRRNRELTLFNRIITMSAKGADERSLTQAVCDELALTLALSRAAVLLFDEGRSAASIVAEYPADAEDSLSGAAFPLDDDSVGEALGGLGAPLVVELPPDRSGPASPYAPLIPRGARSAAVVPLVADGKPFGALLSAATETGRFDGGSMELLGSVAEELSHAFVRSRLERERLRLSAAVEQTGDAVIITDADDVVRYVNPAFERMTGYARSEVIGRAASVFSGDESDRDFFRAARKAIAARGEWRGRRTNGKKDGTPYDAEISISPIREKSGVVVNYVTVQRDITEAWLMERRYLQSQKMEAVGRLAGGIAHDFNNLLTSVIGYVESLSDRFFPDSPERSDLGQIKKAVAQAAGLTKQLLAFSRMQVLQLQALDLNDVAGEMEKMLKPLLGESIEVRTSLDPATGRIRADRGQLEMTIMNLAVNARDAMPGGGVITLSTRNADLDEEYARGHPGSKPGSYAVLTVADTGTGIDEEIRPFIFEPFFTTKAEGKGTGLGLATVYGVVEQSGGHIHLSSEPGRGTSFEVFLPRFEGESPPANAGLSTVLKGTETILVVEDDESVRDVVKKALSNGGYSVSVTKNPGEAAAYASAFRKPIDVLITEFSWPGISGEELAERIRVTRPGLKALFISEYGETELSGEGGRHADTAFLRKPFSPYALVKAIRDILDG